MANYTTRIKDVDFWPASFWRSQALAHAHPIESWGLRSRPVTLLYSRGLRAAEPIPANTPWVRFVVAREGQTSHQMVPVREPTERTHRQPGEPPKKPVPPGFGLFEGDEVAFPEGLLVTAPGPAQRRQTLELLHEQMLLLAYDLDWPQAPLLAAFEHCLSEQLHFRYLGPETSSPDRRRKAWVEVEHDYEGDAWLRVNVRTADGVTALPQTFETWQTAWRAKDLKAALRWVDSDHVEVTPAGAAGRRHSLDVLDPSR